VRDLATILEALVDTASSNRNAIHLVEAARQAMGRHLVRPLLNGAGELKVITLDPAMEEDLAKAFNGNGTAGVFGMQPAFVRRVLEGLRRLIGEQVAIATPILLCSTPARFHLRRILEPFLPKLVVLSPPEIPPRIPVQSVGTVQ